MRVLLLGAGGQVGTELRCSLAAQASGGLVVATRSGELPDGVSCEIADLARPQTLRDLVARVAPDVVVNAAAHTAVDRAEDEPDLAFAVNAEAPRVLADSCASRGMTLVHYSTDYVFDGTGTRPYREADPTAPLGVYGASKLAGEQAIQASGCHSLIIRTAWVYASHGQNFMRTMLRLGAQRDELRVVADQIGTPTPAALIADVTAQMLAAPPATSGLWHLTPTGQTSWYGFAQAIFETALARGLIDRAPRLVPVSTAEYPTRAQRPAWSVLDTANLLKHHSIQLPTWRAALDQVSMVGRHHGLG